MLGGLSFGVYHPNLLSHFKGAVQTPIGLLFNGRKLRIYINPDYPGLGKYKKISELSDPLFNFRHSSVLALDLDDAEPNDKLAYKFVTDVLTSLNCANLSNDVIGYAKKLAEKKLADVKSDDTNKKIVKCLQEALSSPTDEVVRAVATAIHSWNEFETPPGPDDVVRAWHKLKRKPKPIPTIKTVETQAKQSINSIVRQMVVEVCTSKGYGFLATSKVKGLRLRSKGGNGYHPVPKSEAVPNDLHVGGLSSEDAKKVIYQLEAILTTGS